MFRPKKVHEDYELMNDQGPYEETAEDKIKKHFQELVSEYNTMHHQLNPMADKMGAGTADFQNFQAKVVALGVKAKEFKAKHADILDEKKITAPGKNKNGW